MGKSSLASCETRSVDVAMLESVDAFGAFKYFDNWHSANLGVYDDGFKKL